MVVQWCPAPGIPPGGPGRCAESGEAVRDMYGCQRHAWVQDQAKPSELWTSSLSGYGLTQPPPSGDAHLSPPPHPPPPRQDFPVSPSSRASRWPVGRNSVSRVWSMLVNLPRSQCPGPMAIHGPHQPLSLPIPWTRRFTLLLQCPFSSLLFICLMLFFLFLCAPNTAFFDAKYIYLRVPGRYSSHLSTFICFSYFHCGCSGITIYLLTSNKLVQINTNLISIVRKDFVPYRDVPSLSTVLLPQITSADSHTSEICGFGSWLPHTQNKLQ